MHVLITGGTGFIGRHLTHALLAHNHRVTIITRDPLRASKKLKLPQVAFIKDFTQVRSDTSFDAVVNLAGAPIDRRWSKSYKTELLNSRIILTEQLIHQLRNRPNPPKIFISGSAVGYYGPHGEDKLSEKGHANPSFTHELCYQWEQAGLLAERYGARVCLLRTGVVLGKDGGMLKRLRPSFLCGLGGKIGHGLQWLSWIHIDDIVRIIEYCLLSNDLSGPVNATAPMPVTNQEFVKTYAKVLHRPHFMTLPEWLVRTLFGEMGEELLLSGQKVVPKKLLERGFSFQYPDLFIALQQIENAKVKSNA